MEDNTGWLAIGLLALGLTIAALVRVVLVRAAAVRAALRGLPGGGGTVYRSGSRATLASLLGVACVVLGATFRVKADSWSQDEVPGPHPANIIRRWNRDSDRYEFFREAGAWSVGFGLAVLAVTVGAWVAREPVPALPAEPATPDGDGNR